MQKRASVGLYLILLHHTTFAYLHDILWNSFVIALSVSYSVLVTNAYCNSLPFGADISALVPSKHIFNIHLTNSQQLKFDS